MNISDFDQEKYWLGKLCLRGHEWGNGSDRSLRRITNNSCLECEKIANRRDPEKRFRSRFEQTQGCWLWKGRRDQDGYGKLTIISCPVNHLRLSTYLNPPMKTC